MERGKQIKVKKIGIITINDNDNYGNRLQNYAVQEIIKKVGGEAYNIENYIQFNSRKHYFVKRFLYRNFPRNYSERQTRTERFKDFNKLISYYNGIYCPYKKYDFFDYIFSGSDQVWNPEFAADDATLLRYFPANKRIAIAASFGVSSIPDERVKEYADELGKFKAISVREEDGAEIVKNLTEKDAEILVDPTMMLGAEEWRCISKPPTKLPEKKYILTYFLSEKNKCAKTLIKGLEKDYHVISLNDNEDDIARDAGPREFLYLFNNAELILTDSFHACVFSILFNKPFVVYDRQNSGRGMNSRIDTLLRKFDLMRKHYGVGLENNIWEHNYGNLEEILEIERRKFVDFVRSAIDE